MLTNLNQLRLLLKQANQNPWKFFSEHSLKEMQFASHPDKWIGDSVAASEIFTGFGVAHAKSLKPQRTVTSSTREYRIVEELAVGDLRIVHRLSNDWILKEPRTKGKAVNNLVAKEAEILRQLNELAGKTKYAYYFPQIVETFLVDDQRINVTFYDQRLISAEAIKRAYPQGLSGRHIGWMFKRLLTGLGYIHNKGWIHGAITPEHVMFCPENHAGVMVGWIHAEKPKSQIKTVPAHRKDWYPEDAKKYLTSGVDIYMAGKLMTYLMNPEEVPRQIGAFLKATQLPAAMRPQDAWELCDDFTKLLTEVYGVPKFVDLVI